ncbi:hypothetical protein ACL6C3_11920 [Capilliphycus salinus ALCB114379]|uniref:hypothetical protein n=1 Tax=Capilliphycus salinus TaxID=2768948 RepID=UPI0039A46852
MEIFSFITTSFISNQSLSIQNIPPVLAQQTETNRSRRLSDAEITQRLQALPNWKRENQTLING